ncbi:hypothetical protein TRVA0_046S00210 [Trichomonascus vanleenenianus]|uniref:uncharacterized protein n=1 Tax=Trichomonascus vanleenenianus TaxID=2268995 RepID=UPI003ECBAB8D
MAEEKQMVESLNKMASELQGLSLNEIMERAQDTLSSGPEDMDYDMSTFLMLVLQIPSLRTQFFSEYERELCRIGASPEEIERWKKHGPMGDVSFQKLFDKENLAKHFNQGLEELKEQQKATSTKAASSNGSMDDEQGYAAAMSRLTSLLTEDPQRPLDVPEKTFDTEPLFHSLSKMEISEIQTTLESCDPSQSSEFVYATEPWRKMYKDDATKKRAVDFLVARYLTGIKDRTQRKVLAEAYGGKMTKLVNELQMPLE